MNKELLVYIVFAAVMLISLTLDFGWMSKNERVVSMKRAMLQTIFWVLIALGFFGFMWFEEGEKKALEFISAYMMEWSLSIDNIFVFILIFTSFGIRQQSYGRALLLGILMAIVFRVLFIVAGISLIHRFEWLLYFFGAFLLFTGFKILFSKEDDAYQPAESAVYKWMNRYLPLTNNDGHGKFIIIEDGKKKFTMLFVVVILLSVTDLIFAMDSLPAVMGISRDELVIFTSNILAVLGLRSLFFLLRGAVNKFKYLQHGISFVLIFIGLKMLLEKWINEWLSEESQVVLSLSVIVSCIVGSVVFSWIRSSEKN